MVSHMSGSYIADVAKARSGIHPLPLELVTLARSYMNSYKETIQEPFNFKLHKLPAGRIEHSLLILCLFLFIFTL